MRSGAQWALQNQTHIYMQGWFHYAKLYAATAWWNVYPSKDKRDYQDRFRKGGPFAFIRQDNVP